MKAVVGTIMQNITKFSKSKLKFISKGDRKKIIAHVLVTRYAPNISTNLGAKRMKILMGRTMARRRIEFVEGVIF